MLVFGVATLLLSTSSFRSFLQDLFAAGATVFADQAVLTVAVVFALASLCGLSLVVKAVRKSGSSKKTLTGAPLDATVEMSIAEKEAAIFDNADPDQIAMMAEKVILVNERDEVVGAASKKDSHLNSKIDGEGLLHRAFSVFIFDKQGRLMLQQRSSDKITFPDFWANSCCSHPLFTPSELNGVEGAKNAAVRKIEQELGIAPNKVPLDSFHFLTRVHYKARSDDVWGEHEVDYVFICTPPEDVQANPNPNEVQSARYFTREELDVFLRDADANGDLISPWFRTICVSLLPRWWDAYLKGDLESETDLHTIHKAGDTPNKNEDGFYDDGDKVAVAVQGVAANQTARVGDQSLKQGSYGKVQIHKSSKLATISRPSEMLAMLQFKFGAGLGDTPITGTADLDFCDDILTKVSRSFAAVIRQLPEGLKTEICVFYLVLRALDTIEDDMEAFESHEAKIAELKAFTANMQDPSWHITGIGAGDERRLLENYHAVARVFNTLDAGCQEVIADICDRMADGMASYVAKDMGKGTVDIDEYNLYCYYVAGLVGEGLSRLFAYTGFESEKVGKDTQLSISMGTFLQKCNITRDYLEDLVDGRAFWPEEIWSIYAKDLGDLRLPQHRSKAIACLNHMVTDALTLVPHSLEYMDRLRSPEVFKFCAIPQIMSMATLAELYNNDKVFTGVVKIRKSLSAKLIMDCADMDAVHRWFSHFARDIAAKVPRDDPNAAATLQAIDVIQQLSSSAAAPQSISSNPVLRTLNVAAPVVFVALGAHFMARQKARDTSLPRLTDMYDATVLSILIICVLYMLGFTGVALAATPAKTDPQVKGALPKMPAPSVATRPVCKSS